MSPLEVATVGNLTETLNTELVRELTAVGGDDFATIGALAYRQTLAATKLTWNSQHSKQEYRRLQRPGALSTICHLTDRLASCRLHVELSQGDLDKR